jgi:WD40 repeat protein
MFKGTRIAKWRYYNVFGCFASGIKELLTHHADRERLVAVYILRWTLNPNRYSAYSVLLVMLAGFVLSACADSGPQPDQETNPDERPAATPAGGVPVWTEPTEPITVENVPQMRPLGRLGFPGSPSTPFTYDISLDQTQLVAMNNDYMASWDLVTGEQLFANAREDANRVFFGPDKAKVYTLNPEGTIGVFNAADGTPEAQLHGHVIFSGAADYYADEGRLALGGEQGTIRVWDLPGRRALVTFDQETESPVVAVAFAPDGDTLAAAQSDGTITLWNWLERTPIRDLAGPTDPASRGVISLAFSDDGDFLAVNAVQVSVWDVQTGQRLHTLDTGPSTDIFRFLPNSPYLLVDGSTADLTAFNAQTGQTAAVFTGISGSSRSAALSPNGDMMMAAGFNGDLSLWSLTNLASGAVARGSFTRPDPDQVFRLAWTEDGLLVLFFDARGPIDLWGVAEPET